MCAIFGLITPIGKIDKQVANILLEHKETLIFETPQAVTSPRVDEGAAVARFAARVDALGPLSHASPGLKARVLEEVKLVARHVDGSAEGGSASGYDRRVLHVVPGRWSLAAIVLRPGQEIHAHDHDGWGCAATVQGIERNRWFARDEAGNLALESEHDYPPGAGYVFDSEDIHQPVGADSRLATVALHFLVQES